jgi:hypothetical protein
MIITIKIEGRTLALTAPLGAAAYALDQGKDQLKIIFGMMKTGENGLTAINRIRSSPSILTWHPVASRPESQVATSATTDLFVAYTLIYRDGAWMPATSQVANFLKVMQAAQSLPMAPSEDMAINIKDYTRGAVKAK